MNDAQGTRVVARKGFFPIVAGRDVEVRQGGGIAFFARRNLRISEGGGRWLVALGDQTVERGGGATLISRQARVSHGFVGLLISGRTSLEGESRVLMSLPVPAAAALVAGLAAGFLLGCLKGGSAPGAGATPH